MATPKWHTTAGLLDTVEERVAYTRTLSASDRDGDNLSFKVIAGNLPGGLILSESGVISGFPLEVKRRTEYQFVVRATDSSNVNDRTFKIVVVGEDAPTWTTSAGQIGTVRDGDYFSFQLQASDTDSDIKSYEIVEGYLPDSLTLDEDSGFISGVTLPVQQQDYDSTEVGFDGQAYDTVIYDQENRSGSIDAFYEFTVRVSDGISHADRKFKIFVEGLSSLPRGDTTTVTADTEEKTADIDEIRDLYFVQPAGSLGRFKHDNYQVIKIDVVDPGDYLEYSGDTTLSFSISAGTLPAGLAIDTKTGKLYGNLTYQTENEKTYTFTVKATKASSFFIDSEYTREYSITVLGEGYNDITWDTSQKELDL
jgi:hypothetical protein